MPQRTLLLMTAGLAAVFLIALGGSHASWTPMMALTLIGIIGHLAFTVEGHRRENDRLRAQNENLHRLRAAYDQLDQQAKLIIRTDLELHRTQEELDRRLASLMSLHQLGQQLRLNIRPEEVLKKLDANIVLQFGFTKGAVAICPTLETMEWSSLVGLSPQTAERDRKSVV